MQTTTETTKLEIVNGYDIYTKDLPPTKWYVGGVLHEGASLLSGDPKVGKSFLALQVAIAVAGNAETALGTLSVGVHGRVLYLAVDDGSEKRIQQRLHQLAGRNEAAVRNIDFVYQRNLPPLSKGLSEILDDALSQGDYVMVILDTLGAVLDPNQSTRDVYKTDYANGIMLQKLAQKYGICLLILHHTNKGESQDPVARASGSHGLTGAVDSVLFLGSDQDTKFADLMARPRDGESSEICLLRQQNGGWEVTDRSCNWMIRDSRRTELTEQESEVRAILSHGPAGKEEIAVKLQITPDTARKRLERMTERGKVRSVGGGKYEWVDTEPVRADAVCGVPPSWLDALDTVGRLPS